MKDGRPDQALASQKGFREEMRARSSSVEKSSERRHSSQFDQESRDLSHSIVLAPFSEFQESRDIWFQRYTHPRHTPTSGCAADLKLSPDFRKLNDGKYAIQRLAGEYLDRNNPTPSPKPG
ncbi:uncharacterized protein RAG0_06148 [Rhynchosporium agropyri]|uniref:Uncharacterized protein n=1 Tax=Rhynchosporium agropyri TaxID=914238 RepID=A0A1E1KGD2_9HELO|nr:uncharacterized protein RAG0_06148 [Rhynchosporium agropyri]